MKIETLKVEEFYHTPWEAFGEPTAWDDLGGSIRKQHASVQPSFEETKLKARSKMAHQLSIYEERMIRILSYTEGPDRPQRSGCPTFEIVCVILLKDEKEVE